MPLKPPSSAMIKIIRMMVPIDIDLSSADFQLPVVLTSGEKTNRNLESSCAPWADRRPQRVLRCQKTDHGLNVVSGASPQISLPSLAMPLVVVSDRLAFRLRMAPSPN